MTAGAGRSHSAIWDHQPYPFMQARSTMNTGVFLTGHRVKVTAMATIMHEPSSVKSDKHSWMSRLLVPEMWATLAIVAMWLAVLFVGVFGPDFVSSNSGVNATTIPSAIFVALFACIATASVAKRGFRRGSDRDE